MWRNKWKTHEEEEAKAPGSSPGEWRRRPISLLLQTVEKKSFSQGGTGDLEEILKKWSWRKSWQWKSSHEIRKPLLKDERTGEWLLRVRRQECPQEIEEILFQVEATQQWTWRDSCQDLKSSGSKKKKALKASPGKSERTLPQGGHELQSYFLIHPL